MSERLVELAITEVRAAVPLRLGQEAGLAVLSETTEPFRSLHIYIGQAEARAIQAAQRGDRPPRPSTWDLFLSAVALLDATFIKAVINEVQEARHFFASLELMRDDRPYLLPCRPSDALALVSALTRGRPVRHRRGSLGGRPVPRRKRSRSIAWRRSIARPGR